MAVGHDSPAWTFGVNPKAKSPRVPGVGEYDVAGRMVRDGVGTHFSRIGAKPMRPREDVKRLVFETGKGSSLPTHKKGLTTVVLSTKDTYYEYSTIRGETEG